MHRGTLKLNNVPTQVMTESRWVEEGLPEYGKKDIVIVITGNPGIVDFYEGFIKTLKSNLPSEIPIWVIGHAGHASPPSNLQITMPSSWEKHYSLMAQVEHKKDFIERYVPKDAKIHLICHSIGSWIALKLLNDDSIANKITKCYFLFPTIEHMAASRSGWYFSILSRWASLLIFFCWILTCLPLFLQNALVSLLAPLHGVPPKYNKAVLLLLNPCNLKNIIQMANEEMAEVKERDNNIISKYADKLWFYYGNCDGWVPVEYYRNLKWRYPNISAELCKHGYYHSFVLRNEKEVGKLVADVINENIL